MLGVIARRSVSWPLMALSGLLSPSAIAQASASKTLPALSSEIVSALRGGGALADLDCDSHPDLAVAESKVLADGEGYRVNFQLSGSSGHGFDVASRIPGGLRVKPMDVDGDHDIDLVIVTKHGYEPVGVWINDGKGGFSQDVVTEYPSFIWEKAKTWFEAPAPAPARSWLLPVPPSPNRAPPSDAVLLPKTGRGGFASSVRVRPEFLLGHSSGLLRAPPLV